MQTFTSLPLSSLIENMDLYPRHAVDSAHVTTLAMAIESGQSLPPIVADKKTKQITDGWHRCRAYRRVHGEGCDVPVELVTYKDEGEMVMDAVRRNSCHGRRLDKMDRQRSILMLTKHGIPVTKIVDVIHIPEIVVTRLTQNTVIVPKGHATAVPNTGTAPAKQCVSHMIGKRLSKEQANALQSAPGTSYVLLARQLIDAVENKLIDKDNARLLEELRLLRDALDACSYL